MWDKIVWHDWNRNGEKDFVDYQIESNIRKNIRNSNSSNNSYDGGSVWTGIGIIAFIFFVLWIFSLFASSNEKYTCYMPGCDNEVSEPGDTCARHTYNRHSSYQTDSYSTDTSTSDYDSSSNQSDSTSSNTSSSYSNNTSNSTTSNWQDEDTYGVNDYSNAEDFYDDNYDDFDDYDDAESYYDEYSE